MKGSDLQMIKHPIKHSSVPDCILFSDCTVHLSCEKD